MGDTVSLADYQGKVLLVVNTATQCGFTPQYTELQQLYTTYHDRGLEIIDFPCNQFGEQAPGTNEEIAAFCTGNYGTTFPQMAKIDVNGDNAHPIFKYLKSQAKGFLTSSIKWNFTKFLISKDGTSIKRYSPTTKPEKLEKDIESFLSE